MSLAAIMLTLFVAASKLAFSFTIIAPKAFTKASFMSLTKQLEFRLI